MILSRRTLKRIENLGKACEFDLENAVATVNLHFRTVSEIIDTKLSTAEIPVVHTDAITRLEDCLAIVPKEFKVDFKIIIADYQGYDPERILNAYRSAMATLTFKRKTSNKKSRSRMGAFIMMGLFLLLPLILNMQYNWFEFPSLIVSIATVYILELIFELFFEEGIGYFAVTRVFNKIFADERKRIGTIRLER